VPFRRIQRRDSLNLPLRFVLTAAPPCQAALQSNSISACIAEKITLVQFHGRGEFLPRFLRKRNRGEPSRPIRFFRQTPLPSHSWLSEFFWIDRNCLFRR